MRKYHLILLSILSGVLFTVAWPVNGFPAFLFIAFVPLLYVEDNFQKIQKKKCSFCGLVYSYPAFFIWNLLTTWWISNATSFGAIMAVALNSLFMAIIFNLYHITKKHVVNRRMAYMALIAYWTAFEFLHLDWDLSWSWLNLGNGFASYYKWIQWYEYTGTFGGTVWVLFANILIFEVVKTIINKPLLRRRLIALCVYTVLLLFIPIIISFIIYNKYEEKSDPYKVLVVQPNIDPYNEQYGLPYRELLNKLLLQGQKEMDSDVDFMVCPESALQEGIWERRLDNSSSLNILKSYIDNYPGLSIVVGASTYKRFLDGEKHTLTVRYHKQADFFYDAYNTAIFIDSCDDIQLYHKSKLVPGVEKMPFPRLLNPLSELAFDLGGTVGSLGKDEKRRPFVRCKDSLKIAPLICYESIYGEFCARFIRNGAELIFIITNDGWWGDTPGHRQHLTFASLRAIEMRRSIARSANTGISCFVNQKGDIQQATKYWEPAVIKQNINANSELTFYAVFGDYIGRIAAFVSVLFLLITFVTKVTREKDKVQN